jgi:hypothetical protein
MYEGNAGGGGKAHNKSVAAQIDQRRVDGVFGNVRAAKTRREAIVVEIGVLECRPKTATLARAPCT